MTTITEKDLQEWTALCVDPWNGSHLRGDLSRVICTAMPRLIEEVTELREENKQLREEVERLVRGQTLDGFSVSYGKLLLKCDQLRARAERAEFAAMIAQDGRGKKRPWQPYSNKPPMRRRRMDDQCDVCGEHKILVRCNGCGKVLCIDCADECPWCETTDEEG